MIWHHGTPNSSVAVLLLLLLTAFGPVRSCKFKYPPIDTSDFSRDVKPLKEYLLLDYGVLMLSNLKPDIFCGELWDLHLINENVKKLIGVSGKSLAALFMKIYNHTKFIEGCNIKAVSLSLYHRIFYCNHHNLCSDVERVLSIRPLQKILLGDPSSSSSFDQFGLHFVERTPVFLFGCNLR